MIWEWDSLRFLSKLPHLCTWWMSGDPAQLSPYVTMLIKKGCYFPSVMSMITRIKRVIAHVIIKLDLQYRMTPELCEIHAPVFYDYKIRSFRRNPDPAVTVPHGMYVDLTPSAMDRCGETLESVECTRALQIYDDLDKLAMRDEAGSAYTFAIVSPYRATVTNLIATIRARKSASLEALKLGILKVRTVDCIQGGEANVIIVATSRSTTADLLRCRQRGNVAMSRARDISIMMLSHKVGMSTTFDEKMGERRLRFWGQMSQWSKPLDPTNPNVSTWIFDMKTYAPNLLHNDRRDSCSTPRTRQRDGMSPQDTPPEKRSKKIQRQNRGMILARRILPIIKEYTVNSPTAHNKRKELCKKLALRPRFAQCKDFHCNLYANMMLADAKTFERAIEIYAETQNHRNRNNDLFELLGINFHDKVSVANKQMVYDLFHGHATC